MKKKLNPGRSILIGAAIGGFGVIFTQLTIMGLQGRVDFIPLLILGGFGSITGVTWGIVTKLPSEAGRIIGAMVSCIPTCLVVVLISTWYAITPWAAPYPYPNTAVEMTGGTGAWGHFRNQKYMVSLSIDEVEQYYREQMGKYCEGEWEFAEPEDCMRYSHCRCAQCEVRRFGLEQQFTVDLYEISEAETQVSQWDAWQD